jgi:hypothetical protein
MQNITPDKQITFLLSKLSEGIAYCKILTDEKNNPVDWLYLDINEVYEKINNLKKEERWLVEEPLRFLLRKNRVSIV